MIKSCSNVDLESPEIKALGHLFKLTQVFISDDGYSSDSPQSSSFPKHTRFKYVADYGDENYDNCGDKIGSNTAGETQYSLPKHIRFHYDDDDDDGDISAKISSNISFHTAEVVTTMEDLGFTQEMSDLGLPLTFKTSKQNSSGQRKKKSKDLQSRSQQSEKKLGDQELASSLGDQELASSKISEDSPSGADLQDRSSSSSSLYLLDQNGFSCSGPDVRCDAVKSSNFCTTEKAHDGLEECIYESTPETISSKALGGDSLEIDLQMKTEMLSVDATIDLSVSRTCSENDINDNDLDHQEKGTNAFLMEHFDVLGSKVDESIMQEDIQYSAEHIQFGVEQTHVGDLSNDCQDMVLDHDYDENVRSNSTSNGWNAHWDSFYGRYYFYHAETQESTWIPPPGMESFIYCTSSDINAEVPGSNGTLEPCEIELEQLGGSDLVDKAGLDGGENTLGTGEVDADVLFPISGTPFEGTSIVYNKQCQDEIAWSSSVVTLQRSFSSKNVREQEDYDDVFIDHLKSEISYAISKTCESADNIYDGNMTVQLSNSRRSASGFEGLSIHDDSNHKHLEERGTIVNDLPMLEIVVGTKGNTIADDLPMEDTTVVSNKKTRRKNRKKKKFFSTIKDCDLLQAEESYVDLTKYWCQRYLLFSRYDDGIKMDDEGWFSVTPEAIARHQALRYGGGTIIDCFTGAGGNAIQFAKTSKHVIAIDIDPTKIEYAHHNATIYGVEGVIDFMVGDSLSLVSKLKADAVFLSPPWGGPAYAKVKSYDLSMLQPYDGHLLFDTFKTIASMIIMFLPRNVDIVQLAELALSANPPWSLEVEENFLNGKLKAVTAYFSRS